MNEHIGGVLVGVRGIVSETRSDMLAGVSFSLACNIGDSEGWSVVMISISLQLLFNRQKLVFKSRVFAVS